jgi:hypothetical protein
MDSQVLKTEDTSLPDDKNLKTNTAMNSKNKNICDIKKNSHQQEHTTAFGSHPDLDGPTHRRPEIPEAPAKLRGFARPIFVITGMALCMGLSSCVTPYDSYGGRSATVTTYRPGYTINSLPNGYRSEIISGNTYYYNDGHYYRQGSGGYFVVDAPRSSRYYDDYGRRHQTTQTTRTYRESPNRYDPRYGQGEVITRLPSGYRTMTYRGNTYYQADNRYYRRNNDHYVIVSSPW